MVINLDKATKDAKIVLEKKEIFGEKANIKLVVDHSGSTGSFFRHGVVQATIERILAVGMNMDSNKSIEVYAFNGNVTYIGEANESNIEDFVNKVFLKKVRVEGGTRYSPAMQAVVQDIEKEPKAPGLLSKLFGKKEEPVIDKDLPTLVFFVTDGENSDQNITTSYMQEVSSKPIFWQFIGIGYDKMPFLDKLDTMKGRVVDNANFIRAKDIQNMTNSELYEEILNEYPLWLKEARKLKITK